MHIHYPDSFGKANPEQGIAVYLKSVILTEDFRQRRRITVVLMADFVYMVCAGLLLFGANARLFKPDWATVLAVICLVVGTSFVFFIRSGLNLKFSKPSLAFPQAVCAQTLIGFAYATTGALHAATLILLAMVMVFGMFEMETKDVCKLLAYSVLMTGIIMLWCAYDNPMLYPPELQLVYFILTATVLSSISSLSVQLRHLGQRLKLQKAELETALAQIRKIATCDELTGLCNRRQMLAILTEHATRLDRNESDFMVAIVDLDQFKSVNDTFGHRVGDEALICFANQARLHLRSADIIGRWGGEEFLIVLPASLPGDPGIGIDRLRRSLAMTDVSSHAPGLRISFSAGMTRFLPGEGIDDVIERADRALYAAKAAGRRRTVTM
jgi:diguanylate cyclase (GGDEF)-like protein